MSKCKSCGAEIIWVKTSSSSMPCDPEAVHYRPDKAGEAMVVTPSGKIIRARIVPPAQCTGHGYTPHFATCPNA